MDLLGSTLRRAIDALALREEVYRDMRDAPDAVEKGVILIVTVGIIAALAGVMGTYLFDVTMPDVAAIQETVMDGILSMPWTEDVPAAELAEARKAATANVDINRTIMGLFMPSVPKALIGMVTKPVGMVISWLIYGLLAFAFARVLGGRGTLSQTYATTALAASPQLFGALNVLPYVTMAGLGTWGVVCSFVAIKHTHGLSPSRTFWATTLPFVLPVLFVLFLVAVVFMFGLAVGGLAS